MELWPQAVVVPKGHRIRVAVSGSDSPGTGVNPNKGTVTIRQDAAHPSSLLLPVIGTGWRSLEATSGRAAAGSGSTARPPGSLATTGGATAPAVAAAVVLLVAAVTRRRRLTG